MRKKLIISMLVAEALILGSFKGVILAEEFDLGEVVITPTKTPHPLEESTGSVSLVGRKEIDAVHVEDVGDLLEPVTSLKVSRYGSMGQSASLHMRGLRGPQVLVLIDGRPVNSPSAGEADLSWLSTDNIDRIEVSRGPASSLYGANAVAGVVNIITKVPPSKPYVKISSAYGSWDTFMESLEGGGSSGDLGYTYNINYKDSRGYRDNSSHNSKNTDIGLRYWFDEGEIRLSGGYYSDKTGYPGPKPSSDKSKRTASRRRFGNDEVSSLFDYGMSQRYYLNSTLDLLNVKLRIYMNDWDDYNHREWISGGNHHIGDDDFLTLVSGSEIQYTIEPFMGNLLTFGGQVEESEFRVRKQDHNADLLTTDDTHYQVGRTTWSGYLQDEQEIGPFIANFGARIDDPTDYSTQVSPKVGILLKLNPNLNLRASFNRAFRAPTLNDLYWPLGPMGQGNPDLKPEKAKVYEVGLDSNFLDKLLFKSSIFWQTVKKKIEWAPTGPAGPFGNLWQPDNLNKSQTLGVELESKLKVIPDIDLSLGYTYLNAYQKKLELINAQTNQMELYTRRSAHIPKHQLDLGLCWKKFLGVPDLKWDVNARYISKTYNYYQNWGSWPVVFMDIKKQPGYTIINTKFTQRFKNFEVYVACENLFDKEYERFGTAVDDQGYPMPGRSVTLNLAAKF